MKYDLEQVNYLIMLKKKKGENYAKTRNIIR